MGWSWAQAVICYRGWNIETTQVQVGRAAYRRGGWHAVRAASPGNSCPLAILVTGLPPLTWLPAEALEPPSRCPPAGRGPSKHSITLVVWEIQIKATRR